MKYRFCYPLLVPIRLLISILTLSNIVCIFVGKRLSQDTPPPSAPPDYSPPTSYPDDVNYDNTAATEEFFPDSEQLGINICLLAATLYMLYRPRTRFWWLTSNFRLTILSWGFAIAGCYFALSQYIRIVPVHGGCGNGGVSGGGGGFFRYTRMRCWMQLGISASQVAWAVLLVWESFLMAKQKNDRKWNEQRADEEVRGAVMYQPDLNALPITGGREGGSGSGRGSLEYDDGRSADEVELATRTGAGTGTGAGSGVMDLDHPGGGTIGGGGSGTRGELEETLPEYESRRPRGQPLIVDTTHPPRRLAGAVARRMQSESAGHTLTSNNTTTTSASESGTQSATVSLPPPPSYIP
jgi:hypothetical protein